MALETEFCLVLERIVGLILVRIRLCRLLEDSGAHSRVGVENMDFPIAVQ